MVSKHAWLLSVFIASVLLFVGCIQNQSRTPDDNGNVAGVITVSSIFSNDSEIPRKYTCEGDDVNPPLNFQVSDQTKSIRVFVVDINANNFVHWDAYGVPPADGIPENADFPSFKNSFGKSGYGGPCPPPGSGVHTYVFSVYGYDIQPSAPADNQLSKDSLERQLEGHLIWSGSVFGKYSR